MTDQPGPPLPESRWINPTDECPHPERWTATDGDSTEVEVDMIAGMIRGLRPLVVVETGTAFGQTTQAIGHALNQLSVHAATVGHLWSLDPDPVRIRYAYQRVGEMPTVTLVLEASLHWTPLIWPIDVLFCDSLPELRVPEIRHFAEWFRVGTVVLVHDTRPAAGADRIRGGNDLRTELGELPIDFVHLPTPRGLSIGVWRP